MNKPRVRAVLEVLYRVQVEELARMVSDSRVCSK